MEILWLVSLISIYLVGALSGNVANRGIRGKPDNKLINKVRNDLNLPSPMSPGHKLHVHGKTDYGSSKPKSNDKSSTELI